MFNKNSLTTLLIDWGHYINRPHFELGAVDSVFEKDAFAMGGRIDQTKMNETLGLNNVDFDIDPAMERLTAIIDRLPPGSKKVIYNVYAEQCHGEQSLPLPCRNSEPTATTRLPDALDMLLSRLKP